MATFNGDNIFGPTAIFDHDDPPNAEQRTHYPGVSGIERLDLAYEFGITTVEGLLVAPTPADLGALCVQVRALKTAGTVGTLVDNDGIVWPDAVIHRFRTVGRTFPVGYGVGKEYRMEILHVGYNPN